MTQKQANSVKHLAPPCDEAIKAIAGERECGECKGTGTKWHPIKGGNKPQKVSHSCNICNGTGKVKYVWEPEVGEWYLEEDDLHEPFLIGTQSILYHVNSHLDCHIPILDWEKLEQILEGVGYVFEGKNDWLGKHRFDYEGNYGVWISTAPRDSRSSAHKNFRQGYGEAKSRQEAVMLVVIELGEKCGQKT